MRKVMMVGVLVGVGGFLFAEGSQPRVEGSTADALLAEVRALRAEVTQVTSAGIRTQVLVARLQLQEQRVLNAARQLAEAQKELATVQGRINGERARVWQLEDAASRAMGQGRTVYQQAIAEAGTQIEQLQSQAVQLQAREKELLRAVSDEQFRWTELIDRLDALERGLPAGLSH